MTKITHDFFRTKFTRTIKGLMSLFVVPLMCMHVSRGQVTLPHYDGLNYTVGQSLPSQVAGGWSLSSAATTDMLISTGNLNYGGLPDSTGNKVVFASGGEDAVKSFTMVGTTVYCSYIINITDVTTAGLYASGYCVALATAANTTLPGTGSQSATVWTRPVTGGYNIGFSGRANQTTIGTAATNLEYGSTVYPLGTPVLIVISYEKVTGTANDICKLWINPTLGTTEPVSSFSKTTATDLADVSNLFIRQNGSTSTPTIEMDEIRIGSVWADVTPNSSTWNGTTWSNGTPSSTKEAIIAGTFNGPAFDAKKVTVNSGSMTITSGTMTVQNEVINNVGVNGIVFENDANLIQVNSTVNTGNAVVKRTSSPLLRFDYSLWSSPVAGQNLAAFSPLTSLAPNRFYIYDSASDKYTNTVPVTLDPTTTSFTPGAGYLIRMPNTADAGTPAAYPGVFTGVPNNGDVPFTLSTAGIGGYNLVGNPYASPINLFTLQANNSTIIGNTFYMWRKTNGVGTAYCSYVPTSAIAGTYVSNGNAQSPVAFVGNIQTGQGFFVSALTAGPLVFKNGQRVSTATSFFKTKQVAAYDKVWLNAINAAGDFSQMAVTYFDGATQGLDPFDGKYFNDSAFALTSNVNGGEYSIQGRPAFDASDVVALNFKTNVAGDYTISIDHSEGVFVTGQDVYLVDSKTGAETNLKSSSYNFNTASGVDNTRFSLKFQKTLKIDTAAFNENSVSIYKSNGILYVNSGASAISTIKVFDIQGRLVAEQKNVRATVASINDLKSYQTLIVQVISEDNKVVNKKVVN